MLFNIISLYFGFIRCERITVATAIENDDDDVMVPLNEKLKR